MRALPLLTTMCVLALGLGAPIAGASTGGAGYGSTAAVKKKAKKKKTSGKTRSAASRISGLAVFPGPAATIGPDGLAIPPAGAPAEVVAAIEAANAIVGKPYKYGGGHAKVEDSGYDCSGTVSYALLAADLLEDDTPLDSRSFMRWGQRGQGTWFTVYTNPRHAFAVIAGLRLDTSAAGDPSGDKGPRWRPTLRSTRGFRARHPEGF